MYVKERTASDTGGICTDIQLKRDANFLQSFGIFRAFFTTEVWFGRIAIG
jgi:hypothetical protein